MIHTRIKTLRTLKNIPQKTMAKRLHKSQSAYSRMENGELQISSEDLVQIAEVLGCKPEDLLNENGIINVLQHNQHAAIAGVNYDSQTYAETDNDTIQILLDNQNKVIEEMKSFITNQSAQNMKFLKELVESVRK